MIYLTKEYIWLRRKDDLCKSHLPELCILVILFISVHFYILSCYVEEVTEKRTLALVTFHEEEYEPALLRARKWGREVREEPFKDTLHPLLTSLSLPYLRFLLSQFIMHSFLSLPHPALSSLAISILTRLPSQFLIHSLLSHEFSCHCPVLWSSNHLFFLSSFYSWKQ